MPKLLIFDAFTLLICEKNVAIYALLRCKIFSLKIWLCKFLTNSMSVVNIVNNMNNATILSKVNIVNMGSQEISRDPKKSQGFSRDLKISYKR